MIVPPSLISIQRQTATAYWYQDPHFLMGSSDFQRGIELGRGSFSIVEKVSCQGREWALKIPLTEKGFYFIQREVDLLVPLNKAEKEINQEYLVQIVALIKLNNFPMALLPLYQGGDLYYRIEKSTKGLSLESTLKITEQMLKALSFLKEQKIIHRDIKPENIFMLGVDDTIRLGDFGLAMIKGDVEQENRRVGTRQYFSPELLELTCQNPPRLRYDFPVDMWATGCTMFFAFSRISLFNKDKSSEWIEKLKSEQESTINDFDANMSKIFDDKKLARSGALTLFQDTLKKMLDLNPAKRLTPEEGKAWFSENASPVSISATEELP